MSDSIVGALKNVGEKLQSVQDGQEEGGKLPPPWGFAGEKKTPEEEEKEEKAASVSPDTDSAKEASPGLISPTDPSSPIKLPTQGNPSSDLSSATQGSDPKEGVVVDDEQNPQGVPPIIRLESEEILSIQLDAPLHTEQSISGPECSVNPAVAASSPTQSDTTGKSSLHVEVEDNDIVFSSTSHRRRKGKKKRTRPGMDQCRGTKTPVIIALFILLKLNALWTILIALSFQSSLQHNYIICV